MIAPAVSMNNETRNLRVFVAVSAVSPRTRHRVDKPGSGSPAATAAVAPPRYSSHLIVGQDVPPTLRSCTFTCARGRLRAEWSQAGRE
jgi:hypothetical protein